MPADFYIWISKYSTNEITVFRYCPFESFTSNDLPVICIVFATKLWGIFFLIPMARPKKIGLDYFPMDVDLNDQVQALELIHGNDGFVWLIKFWQLAYKNEFGEVVLSGLFGDISAKNSRITPDKQRDIISVCMQLGLIYEVLSIAAYQLGL